jgi:hypothetical protein
MARARGVNRAQRLADATRLRQLGDDPIYTAF